MSGDADKIVGIFGQSVVAKGEPNKSIIELLELTLEEARRGEIDGISIAMSRPNDKIGNRFDFGTASFRLIAASSYAHADLLGEVQAVERTTSGDAV
jgi:hypothetical protein